MNLTLWVAAVSLASVLGGCYYAKIRFNMKPGNGFASKWVNVVNVMLNPGFSRQSGRLQIKLGDFVFVGPRRSPLQLSGISEHVVCSGYRPPSFGVDKSIGEFIGCASMAGDPFCSSGSTPIRQKIPFFSIVGFAVFGIIKFYSFAVGLIPFRFGRTSACFAVRADAAPSAAIFPEQFSVLFQETLGTFLGHHPDYNRLLQGAAI